jgi:VanZ family protein
VIWRLLACVWMGVIWHLSASSPEDFAPFPFLFSQMDKTVHAGVFSLLGFFWCKGLPGRAGVAFLIAMVWGALDEWHQSFVPGRTMDLVDVLANAVGAGIAVVITRRWNSRQNC